MSPEEKQAAIWRINDQRNKGMLDSNGNQTLYPDGKTVRTYRVMSDGTVRYDLNQYGYKHRSKPCQECGQWECDYQGVGHYRG